MQDEGVKMRLRDFRNTLWSARSDWGQPESAVAFRTTEKPGGEKLRPGFFVV